jgi:hypothetical protein
MSSTNRNRKLGLAGDVGCCFEATAEQCRSSKVLVRNGTTMVGLKKVYLLSNFDLDIIYYFGSIDRSNLVD